MNNGPILLGEQKTVQHSVTPYEAAERAFAALQALEPYQREHFMQTRHIQDGCSALFAAHFTLSVSRGGRPRSARAGLTAQFNLIEQARDLVRRADVVHDLSRDYDRICSFDLCK